MSNSDLTQGEFYIVRSRPELDNVFKFIAHLWPMLDQPVCLKVGKYSSSRTMSQNALFHVWCREAAKHFNVKDYEGVKADERMKMVFKHDHLGYLPEDAIPHRTTSPQLRHTSNLSVGDMFTFMTKVDAWCVERGLFLSKPAESDYVKLREKNA